MRRVHVVGTSGAGKTIFAASLAHRLAVPHVEIDALAWGPDWVETPRGELHQRLAAALAGPSWVVDGNYGFLRDLVWSRADTVVWLDFSFAVVMGRVLRRTAGRVLRHEELWSGNRETVRTALGRSSIVLWSLKTFRRRRRDYPAHLASRPDLTVVRLRSPSEARRWLGSMDPPASPAE